MYHRSVSWLWLSLFVLLGLLTTCQRKDPEPAPPDPCKALKPFRAEFKIQEQVSDSLVETDSVLFYKSVTFTAGRDYDSYEWRIGEDDRTFDTKSVTLFFADDVIGRLINVRLIAKGKANVQCFPNDKSVDTLTKSFRIINWQFAPIIGRYEGYFGSDPNKTDKQVVEIKYITDLSAPDYIFGRFSLVNVNKGCNVSPGEIPISWGTGRGARAAKFAAEGIFAYDCSSPDAWTYLKGRDTLMVDFTTREPSAGVGQPPPVRIKDSFVGRRIR